MKKLVQPYKDSKVKSNSFTTSPIRPLVNNIKELEREKQLERKARQAQRGPLDVI